MLLRRLRLIGSSGKKTLRARAGGWHELLIALKMAAAAFSRPGGAILQRCLYNESILLHTIHPPQDGRHASSVAFVCAASKQCREDKYAPHLGPQIACLATFGPARQRLSLPMVWQA